MQGAGPRADVDLFDLTVVIPTYNEVENLAELVGRLQTVLSGRTYELLVVDDNSPDGTWQLAEKLAAETGVVRVIRRIDENGLSSAIIRGMQESRGSVIAVMDADMQHDETILPKMVDAISSGAQVCVGSRKAEGGGFGEWSVARRFVSWAATMIARTAIGTTVSDPMSGFFTVDRDYFRSIEGNLNPRGFKVLLELLSRGNPSRVVEVGYVFRERRHGETKLSGSVVYEYLLGVIDLRLGRVVSAQTVTYLLVTFAGMLVNLIGYLGARLADIPRTESAFIGFELALMVNFVGNNRFTFSAASYKGMEVVRGVLIFQLISLYAMLVQFSVFFTLKNHPPFSTVPYGGSLTANAIGIISGAVATYFLHIRYTWNRFAPGRSLAEA